MGCCRNWDSLRTKGSQTPSLDKVLTFTATYWMISKLCHSFKFLNLKGSPAITVCISCKQQQHQPSS